MSRFTATPGTPNSVVSSGPRRSALRNVTLAMVALLCAAPGDAGAAAPWHDDLGRAREASRVSHRPVLAIFTATWQPGGAAVADTALGTPDARALVAACFEPVLIDVDQHADLTRRLGIKHVPTAAVINERDEVLASFACPATAPEFVVAAAQAAQQATAHRQRLEETSRRIGSTQAPESTGANASISVVTGKVRRLSDFASHEPAGAAPAATATVAAYQQPAPGVGQAPAGVAARDLTTPDPNTLARTIEGQTAQAQTIQAQTAPAQTAPGQTAPGQTAEDPSIAGQTTQFPRKPPAWPAETSFTPLASTIAGTPPQRPTLEPLSAAASAVTVPQATPATPWLGGAAAARPVDEPESTASVSDIPAATPGPQAGVVAKKPSPAAQMLAALQKPFSGMNRKPTTAAGTVLPQPPTAPPTLAPARPQWPTSPFAATPSRAGDPAASGAAQPTPGVQPPAAMAAPFASQSPPAAGQAPLQESMPLGLEGYCPVTLAAKGAWAEGRAQYGVRHRGRTYLFAGAAEQQTFLADPDRYAPALSGDDPVIAFEQGRSMPGQRRYGVKCDARMYLFSSPETRAAFQAQPERYTTRIAQAEQPASAGTRTY